MDSLDQIEFSYNFNLFLKMFSGEEGELGTNYYKSLIEQNSNYVEFE